MEAIQEHPVWWGAQARLQFLSRLSDFLAVEERAGLRESLHSVTAGWVLGERPGRPQNPIGSRRHQVAPGDVSVSISHTVHLY